MLPKSVQLLTVMCLYHNRITSGVTHIRGKGCGAGLPDKVQAELAVKRKEKMKEKFAKMKEKRQAKKAAHKATASLAIPMGPFPFPGEADAPVVNDAFALAASSKSTTA